MSELHAKDPCSCGSGKRYKHCHMPREKQRSRNTVWLVAVPVVVVAVVGLALWARRPDRAQGMLPGGIRSSAAPATSGSLTSANQSPLPDGRAPQAWEFDASGNRHWDPGHGHWHDGPPPPPEQRTVTEPERRTSHEDNPSIPNPEPWQYDASKDLHYDPGHGHWHSGQPPAADQRGATATQARPPVGNPSIPNPQPWQYDPVSDRHFNPEHGHWHSGPPPANRDSP